MSNMKLCLVLGPEGSGKTMLLRKLPEYSRLHHRSSKVKETVAMEDTVGVSCDEVNQTIPTVGTNIQRLQFSKNTSCTLKEYGGQMAPIWCNAYKDASMVIYTIDASNRLQVSFSIVALLDLLSAEPLKGKPLLIFFNKTDLPLGMSLVEYKSVMRLEDIMAHSRQPLEVVEGSCWSGNGLDTIFKWIASNHGQ